MANQQPQQAQGDDYSTWGGTVAKPGETPQSNVAPDQEDYSSWGGTVIKAPAPAQEEQAQPPGLLDFAQQQANTIANAISSVLTTGSLPAGAAFAEDPRGTGEAFGRNVANALPFGLGDPAAAATSATIGWPISTASTPKVTGTWGERYSRVLTDLQNARAKAGKDYPGASKLGTVVGALPTALLQAELLGPGYPVLKSALSGGAEGAGQAFSNVPPGEPWLWPTAKGGLIGAGVGAAIPAGQAAVSSVGRKVGSAPYLRDIFPPPSAADLPPPPPLKPAQPAVEPIPYQAPQAAQSIWDPATKQWIETPAIPARAAVPGKPAVPAEEPPPPAPAPAAPPPAPSRPNLWSTVAEPILTYKTGGAYPALKYAAQGVAKLLKNKRAGETLGRTIAGASPLAGVAGAEAGRQNISDRTIGDTLARGMLIGQEGGDVLLNLLHFFAHHGGE